MEDSPLLSERRAATMAALLGLAVLFAPAPARAQASAPPGASAKRWTYGAGVETDFPVDLAARFEIEAPFRLRLSTSLGFLPSPYVKTMNGVLEDLGAYDAATGTLITSTLQSSFVCRTHVGVRPFENLGLYGDVGYGLVALGGSTTTSVILAALTGKTFSPTDAATGTKSFGVSSTLHMLDVEIGWAFPVADHWQLRTALGGAFTLAAPTSVSPQFMARSPGAVASFDYASAAYVSHEMTHYVFTPVLTLGGAYLF